MTTIELLKAVNAKAMEVKKQMTTSYFSGDKSFYNEMLAKFPKIVCNDVYENINNISAKFAQSIEY